MDSSPSQDRPDFLLHQDILEAIEGLSTQKNFDLIQKALATFLKIAERETDRLDWKILTASLED